MFVYPSHHFHCLDLYIYIYRVYIVLKAFTLKLVKQHNSQSWVSVNTTRLQVLVQRLKKNIIWNNFIILLLRQLTCFTGKKTERLINYLIAQDSVLISCKIVVLYHAADSYCSFIILATLLSYRESLYKCMYLHLHLLCQVKFKSLMSTSLCVRSKVNEPSSSSAQFMRF